MKLIRTRAPAPTTTGAWLLIGSALLTSCLVDSADRCGTHQVQQAEICVCEPGFGLVGNECLACGENEVGALTGCECEPGFGRGGSTEPCMPVVSLGKACVNDAECTDATFDYCQTDGDAGYCTRPDCATSADCSNDYSCNRRGSRAFCERPPSGFGQSCHSSDDCSAFEASYCESLSSNVCLKDGCKADPSICPGDWSCCDIALLGNSLCLPSSELESGACPAGGKLITGGN